MPLTKVPDDPPPGAAPSDAERLRAVPTERLRAVPTERLRAVPTGRFARFTRLGGLATGLAGQAVAGRAQAALTGRAPDMAALLLTPRNVTRITDRLSEMRGAAMKLGQLLSMETGDVLPPELADILARLRADADAMPPAQLKAVLAAAYGDGFRRLFRSFDTRPLAAVIDELRTETPSAVTVIIGPEGDLTGDETQGLLAAGAIPVSLGSLTLRAETAAIYAVSALACMLNQRISA